MKTNAQDNIILLVSDIILKCKDLKSQNKFAREKVLLVEGWLDYNILQKVLNNKNVIVYRIGQMLNEQFKQSAVPNIKVALIDAMKQLREDPNLIEGNEMPIAIIDRDFDMIDAKFESNLLLTDYTDMEMTLINSRALPLERFVGDENNINIVYCLAFQLGIIREAFYQATECKKFNIRKYVPESIFTKEVNRFCNLENGVDFKKLIDLLSMKEDSKINKEQIDSQLLIGVVKSKIKEMADFDGTNGLFKIKLNEFNIKDHPECLRHIRGHDFINLLKIYDSKFAKKIDEFKGIDNFIVNNVNYEVLKKTTLIKTLDERGLIANSGDKSKINQVKLDNSYLEYIDKVNIPDDYKLRFNELNNKETIIQAIKFIKDMILEWQKKMKKFFSKYDVIFKENKSFLSFLKYALNNKNIPKTVFNELKLSCKINKSILKALDNQQTILKLEDITNRFNAIYFVFKEAIDYIDVFIKEKVEVKVIEKPKESPLALLTKHLNEISKNNDSKITIYKAIRALYYASYIKFNKPGDVLVFLASMSLYAEYATSHGHDFFYNKLFFRLSSELIKTDYTMIKVDYELNEHNHLFYLAIKFFYHTFIYYGVHKNIFTNIPERYHEKMSNINLVNLCPSLVFSEIENKKINFSNLSTNSNNLIAEANQFVSDVKDEKISFVEAIDYCL